MLQGLTEQNWTRRCLWAIRNKSSASTHLQPLKNIRPRIAVGASIRLSILTELRSSIASAPKSILESDFSKTLRVPGRRETSGKAFAPHHIPGAAIQYQNALDGSEQEDAPMSQPALLVFSGGTAFNNIAGQLQTLTTCVTHVLPVSDDGGSTAEIVRVLGGPAVGDIRSRCLRLADDSNEEAEAVRGLLAHRLPGNECSTAKAEWSDIVEGEHPLWHSIGEPYKHTIRAFLVYFHTQILRQATERFDFRNGSVGNFFFAGARLFFRSLESAIFLFSRVARIPEGSLVLPVIRTEGNITLGAELADGSIIRGQNQISHPSSEGLSKQLSGPSQVDKDGIGIPLQAPIRRVLYLGSLKTAETEEIMTLNPSMLTQLEAADAIIYGMGSLYTSICPSLILEGVGETIARRHVPKILLLNGSHDRETSVSLEHGGLMTAKDIVKAVSAALNRDYGRLSLQLQHPTSAYVTALLVPKGGAIDVNREDLAALGIRDVLEVEAQEDSASGKVIFEPMALIEALGSVICPES